MAFFSTQPRKRKPSVRTTWNRIDKWLAKHLPAVAASLSPGASAKEISEFETATRRRLPDDVKESLAVHNGQQDIAAGVVFGLRLLPLDRVLSDWETVRKMVDDDGAACKHSSSKPKDAVQCCHEHPGWIPLTDDWSGSHLGVDLAPGLSGTWGQVINFGKSEYMHFAISHSWGDFLADVMEHYAAGNVLIQGDEFTLKEPAKRHFCDALPQLYKQHSRTSAG